MLCTLHAQHYESMVNTDHNGTLLKDQDMAYIFCEGQKEILTSLKRV